MRKKEVIWCRAVFCMVVKKEAIDKILDPRLAWPILCNADIVVGSWEIQCRKKEVIWCRAVFCMVVKNKAIDKIFDPQLAWPVLCNADLVVGRCEIVRYFVLYLYDSNANFVIYTV